MGMNVTKARDLYPGISGFGIGAVATGVGSAGARNTLVNQTATGTASGTGAVTGTPLTLGSGLAVWAVFAALVVGVMLLGQRIGPAEDFRNVRLTFFNALAVSGLAVVGILFWKFVFTTFKVPIVSDLLVSV